MGPQTLGCTHTHTHTSKIIIIININLPAHWWDEFNETSPPFVSGHANYLSHWTCIVAQMVEFPAIQDNYRRRFTGIETNWKPKWTSFAAYAEADWQLAVKACPTHSSNLKVLRLSTCKPQHWWPSHSWWPYHFGWIEIWIGQPAGQSLSFVSLKKL